MAVGIATSSVCTKSHSEATPYPYGVDLLKCYTNKGVPSIQNVIDEQRILV